MKLCWFNNKYRGYREIPNPNKANNNNLIFDILSDSQPKTNIKKKDANILAVIAL